MRYLLYAVILATILIGERLHAACVNRPLTPDIIKQVATKYKLDVELLNAIVFVESSGKLNAHNKRSNDFGLMQINAVTAQSMGLDERCLLKDALYNLEAGAQVLSYMRKRYAHKEQDWICRYNVGTGYMTPSRLKLCRKYVARIEKQLSKGEIYVASEN